MATTAEQVSEALATLGGELRTEMATLTGSVNNLATEVRMDREARDRSDREHDRLHLDHAARISALETWRTTVTATESAVPRLTWPMFLRDTKSWMLAILTIGALAYGFFK